MAKTTALSLDEAVKRSPHKWVYLFSEGNAKMRDLLGGKGAGVAEMTNAGLPVPPGFTITTEACNAYYAMTASASPTGMWDQALAALRVVEEQTGKKLGDAENPLLVSVRSGAKFSMPGMMDTVLNLGLNDETVQGPDRPERRRALRLRRLPPLHPDVLQDRARRQGRRLRAEDRGVQGGDRREDRRRDPRRGAQAHGGRLQADRARRLRHATSPRSRYEQLRLAIEAVFASWNNKRAIDYRNFNKIAHDLGTAVNVQTMVFGNMGDDSATGVAFTRNPSTGEKKLYGDYLINAQGEDVVAGIRNTSPIEPASATRCPASTSSSRRSRTRLEGHYRDVQDLEFTIERGRLYMLQTRSAKRTAAAAVKVAVDMVRERLISEKEAMQRVEPQQVVQLLLPRFDEKDIARAKEAGASWRGA